MSTRTFCFSFSGTKTLLFVLVVLLPNTKKNIFSKTALKNWPEPTLNPFDSDFGFVFQKADLQRLQLHHFTIFGCFGLLVVQVLKLCWSLRLFRTCLGVVYVLRVVRFSGDFGLHGCLMVSKLFSCSGV